MLKGYWEEKVNSENFLGETINGKAKKMEEKSLWKQLCELPENMVGEIFNDELIASPRPGPRHASASVNLVGKLSNLFGDGNESGWRIICDQSCILTNLHKNLRKKMLLYRI